MRKVIRGAVGAGTGGIGSWVLEMTILDLTTLQWAMVATLVGGLVFIGLSWPEIRVYIDPSERVLRRSERAAQRERSRQRNALKQHIAEMRQYGAVEVSPDQQRIKVSLRSKTWRSPVMDRACWMANHWMMPGFALRLIARRLGFREEPSESMTQAYPTSALV
jgi:hypothetical protein